LRVGPAVSTYQASIAQATGPQVVRSAWSHMKGMELVVKPANPDDCVLLISNAAVPRDTEWALFRSNDIITPKFSTHTSHLDDCQFVCIASIDQPGKRTELCYHVAAKVEDNTPVQLSSARHRRHLAAVVCPADQVRFVEDDAKQVVAPGGWMDVNEFSEMIVTRPGDKVLCLCVLTYCANWSSELHRGRFTIVRDDVGLDGVDRGLQSVRALGPHQPRVLLMATLDDPPAGPHLYRVRAATTGDTGAVNSIEGDRQLSLIRLPGHLVSGPCRARPVTVDEPRWIEIPGMSSCIRLERSRDRVLVVYHADAHPQEFSYKVHFTVFRQGERGAVKNLGFTDDMGMETVTSDRPASSDYPVGLFVDAPGSAGDWIYSVGARVENVGVSKDCPAVVTGHVGSISLVLLASR